MTSPQKEVKLQMIGVELAAISRELNRITKSLEGAKLYNYSEYKRSFHELSSRLALLAREI